MSFGNYKDRDDRFADARARGISKEIHGVNAYLHINNNLLAALNKKQEIANLIAVANGELFPMEIRRQCAALASKHMLED